MNRRGLIESVFSPFPNFAMNWPKDYCSVLTSSEVQTMPTFRLVGLVFKLFIAILLLCSFWSAEETSFYLVWGTEGNWDGSLELQDGRLIEAKPFRFEANRGDRMISHRRPQSSLAIKCPSECPRHPSVRAGATPRTELQDERWRETNKRRGYPGNREAGQANKAFR